MKIYRKLIWNKLKKNETETIISTIDAEIQILQSKKRENETLLKQYNESIIQRQQQISHMRQIVKMRQHEIDENVTPVLSVLCQQVKDLQTIQTECRHIQSKHDEFLLKCKSKETSIKKISCIGIVIKYYILSTCFVKNIMFTQK